MRTGLLLHFSVRLGGLIVLANLVRCQLETYPGQVDATNTTPNNSPRTDSDTKSNKDPCDQIRKDVATFSNEEMQAYLMKISNDSFAACSWTVNCQLHKPSGNECEPLIDKIGKCFPATGAGQTAIVSCMAWLSGISYDETENATRYCQENGIWEEKTNYSNCKPRNPFEECIPNVEFTKAMSQAEAEAKLATCRKHVWNLKMISYTGRALALVTLTASFFLFWTLKSIRCWRNIIHWNLVASFMLRIVLWFINYSPWVITQESKLNNAVFCRILVTVFHYAQATNYFWMFVEGLYLHMMVVLAYSYDRIKLKVYNAIGWGIPAVPTLLWAIMKYTLEDSSCWLPSDEESKMVDYFFQVPIIVLLLANAIILGNVVRIIFIKLRSGYVSGGNASEAAHYKQYSKAVKAALFLFPLLGVTYIIFFLCPDTKNVFSVMVFWYCNSFLQSFQGFFVCLIYCFANNEIQRALVKKINHWRWQMRWPCCLWRKRDHTAMNRSGSNASLSRTNNTIIHMRTREQTEYGTEGANRREKGNKSPASPKSNEAAALVMIYSRLDEKAEDAHNVSYSVSVAAANVSDTGPVEQDMSLGLLSDRAV